MAAGSRRELFVITRLALTHQQETATSSLNSQRDGRLAGNRVCLYLPCGAAAAAGHVGDATEGSGGGKRKTLPDLQ